MRWSDLASTLLIAALAPTLDWARAEPDPHVALRARAGLPDASATGEVRILVTTLYLPGQTSTVARRDARGRWTVSEVMSSYGVQKPGKIDASTRRLSRRSATELEALLDDPGLYQTVEREEGPCLDPPSTDVEVAWKGRTTLLSENCDPDERITALWSLLKAR